ncbi:hypothetical protein CXB77_04870 [Chromatium okenii]|uniref:Uncharacterized protein n=1 Tax=Chromatium okenii TaxID=61644 RepID=A0A2S7XTH7_9GAMM|nr:hypothetical protein CXB77_04870 [Chromatium okenii]
MTLKSPAVGIVTAGLFLLFKTRRAASVLVVARKIYAVNAAANQFRDYLRILFEIFNLERQDLRIYLRAAKS